MRGTFIAAREAAKRMLTSGVAERGVGRIVNIASIASQTVLPGLSVYCGSKAAVNLLTHVLAIELGPHGVRVNAVAPGLVLDQVYRPGDQHEFAYVTQSLEGTPMQRTGSPDDIAEAVVFLAGRNNPWLSGSILPVTGGSHCGRTHVPLSRGLR